MPKDFYTQWLGLPPGPRPPDHYTLLGLKLYERDRGAIRRAAERQSKRLRERQHDGHLAGQAESLLDKIARAASVLQDPTRKAKYDARLRRHGAGGDPLVGQELHGYRILAKLGEGGTAAVYKAKHLTERRQAALKILTGDPHDVKRCLREAHAARTLNHPNIVTVYGVWRAQDHCCIEMELVEGVSVQELLNHRRRLEVEEATQVVREVARALAMAHGQGIVHRDVKPSNILRTKRGEVKLSDFGLAKTVRTPSAEAGREVVGTPEYMSPEQCDGQPPDARSDIYSLGATFFQLLTGETPIQGRTVAETMWRHKTDPVRDPQAIRPEVGCAFCQIIRKMMAKEPAARYQQCDELLPDLEHALRDPQWVGPLLEPPPLPTTEDEDTQWQDEQPADEPLAHRATSSARRPAQARKGAGEDLAEPEPVAHPAPERGHRVQKEISRAATPMPPQPEPVPDRAGTSWRRAVFLGVPVRWLAPLAVLGVATATGVAALTARIRGGITAVEAPSPAVPIDPRHVDVTPKLTSDPVGADVEVDGTPRGRTPLGLPRLTAGPHKFVLNQEGYLPMVWQGSLEPGERNVFLKLKLDYHFWYSKGAHHIAKSEWTDAHNALSNALKARPGDAMAGALVAYVKGQMGKPSPTTRPEAGPTPTREPKPAALPTRPEYNGSEMVLIPSGAFRMGREGSEHEVQLPAFRISTHEVTNEQWKLFVDAKPEWRKDRIDHKRHNGRYLSHWTGNSHPPELAKHPVVYVSWFAAAAYCEWAGGRLPNEAEWEKAARGTEGRKFPWGNTWDPSRCNSRGNKGSDTFGQTAPVGSFLAGASPYGLLDMAGNVWEWTSSMYARTPYKPDGQRDRPSDTNASRVWRGGSYKHSEAFCDSTLSLRRSPPSECGGDLGFRLCSSAER